MEVQRQRRLHSQGVQVIGNAFQRLINRKVVVDDSEAGPLQGRKRIDDDDVGLGMGDPGGYGSLVGDLSHRAALSPVQLPVLVEQLFDADLDREAQLAQLILRFPAKHCFHERSAGYYRDPVGREQEAFDEVQVEALQLRRGEGVTVDGDVGECPVYGRSVREKLVCGGTEPQDRSQDSDFHLLGAGFGTGGIVVVQDDGPRSGRKAC